MGEGVGSQINQGPCLMIREKFDLYNTNELYKKNQPISHQCQIFVVPEIFFQGERKMEQWRETG